MKTEIIVRVHNWYYDKVVNDFAKLIADNTDMKVSVVDHTKIDYADFHHEDGETLVSLDRHVAERLGIAYYRISRIFDYTGDVVGRYESGCIMERGENVRILDTDIVNGDTIRYACERFGTTKYSVPLVIQPHQDLIDIEDIMTNSSIIIFNKSLIREIGVSHANPLTRLKSYLWNTEIFKKRTSLPKHLFDPILKFKDNYFESLNSNDYV